MNGTIQIVTFGDWQFPWESPLLHGSLVSVLLLLICIPWYEVMLCLATHLLKSTWVVSSFCFLRESCCEHSCTVFNVNINLLFSGISAQEYSGWSVWKSHVLQETVVSLLSTYLCHCIWVEFPMTDYCWITLFYYFNLVCQSLTFHCCI